MAENINNKKIVPVVFNTLSYLDSKDKKQKISYYNTLSEDFTALNGTVRDGWYVVNEDITINSRVNVTGDVKLLLLDGAKLNLPQGINVTGEDKITIYVQSNDKDAMGSLVIDNVEDGNAGIGGSTGENGGMVTINGGNILITGGEGGAGIGGGSNGSGGEITINGGAVTVDGDIAIGAGNGATDATINLGWKNVSDYIAVSGTYNGTVYFISEFQIAEILTEATLANINNMKIIPKLFGFYSYLDENGDKQKTLCREIVDENDENCFCNLTDGWYVVNKDITVDNELIIISGDVKIILCDGATLTMKGGIQVEDQNSLTIYAQSNSEETVGRLYAYSYKEFPAAIGSSDEMKSCGNITINGGKITAIGRCKGAGIGSSGYYGRDHNNDGIITINNGFIDAMGTDGAGIGGGYHKDGGEIIINGGIVFASSSKGGAGIGGGGESRSGGKITINGGEIIASSRDGADIGGGCYGGGGEITINGGTVYAKGGFIYSDKIGAGIGGGASGAGGDITINGGTVFATNCSYDKFWGKGAVIGSGCGGADGGTITINGGKITAKASEGEIVNDTDVAFGTSKGGNTGTIIIGMSNPGDYIDAVGIYNGDVSFSSENLFVIDGTTDFATLSPNNIDNKKISPASRKVNFIVNGYGNGLDIEDLERPILYNKEYGTLPTPIWKNHNFEGWFTDAEGGDEITASTVVTSIGEQSLYAHWSVDETEASIKVIWDDENNSENIRPDSVNITFSDTNDVFTLNADNNWTATKGSLPKYDEFGDEIDYNIWILDSVEGYTYSSKILENITTITFTPSVKVADSTSDSGESTSGSGENTSGSGENTSGSGGNTSDSGENTLGSGENTSDSGESTSGSGENTSGSVENTSGSGENTSGSGEQTSGSGENTSDSGENTSGSGENTSGSGEQTSGSGETTSGSGENTSESDENTSTSGSGETTSGSSEKTSGSTENTSSLEDKTSGNGENTATKPVNDTTEVKDTSAVPETEKTEGDGKKDNDKKDNDKKLSPTAVVINNDDGSVTERDKTVNSKGTVKVIEKTEKPDGTVITSKEVTYKDGSGTFKQETKGGDGSSSTVTNTRSANGNEKTTTRSLDPEGNVTIINETKKYNEKTGRTTDKTITVNPDKTKETTVRKTKENGDYTETCTIVDESGKKIETYTAKRTTNEKTGSVTESIKVKKADTTCTSTVKTVYSDGAVSAVTLTETGFDGSKTKAEFSIDQESGNCIISSFTTGAETVTIPEVIVDADGVEHPIISIPAGLFSENVTSIVLSSNIETITKKAFSGLENLTSIVCYPGTKFEKNSLKGTSEELTIVLTFPKDSTKKERAAAKKALKKQLKKAGNKNAKIVVVISE